MGSITHSLIPIFNASQNSVVSTVASTAGLTKSSLLALTNPTVSAANEINNFRASLASDENCAYLQSVGVAGDAMCNKYAGAYVEEIKTADPEEVYQKLAGWGSFVDSDKDGEPDLDSNGNPEVDASSDYAKYLVACVSSTAQPGTMNSAVEGFIQKYTSSDNAVANGLINFGLNFVPGSGLLDAVDGWQQLYSGNFDWNSGLACTGNVPNNPELNEKVKYYSMYNLDQRVLENMGLIEKSSSVSFLEDYYRENPLDQSLEGQIARFSGMTKEQVSDTLALIDYYNYIAQYDPSTRYQMGEESPEPQPLDFGGQTIGQNDGFIIYDATLWDSRQRNYAIA